MNNGLMKEGQCDFSDAFCSTICYVRPFAVVKLGGG